MKSVPWTEAVSYTHLDVYKRQEYTETEKTFQDMYLMFYQSRSGYGYKLTIFFMGLLILFMQVSPNPSILTPKYIIQAAVIWALAFLLGFLGNKYIYSGFNRKNAVKSGTEAYTQRIEKRLSLIHISIEVKAGAAGKVFKIEAGVGTSVKRGDAVVIIEAMKMEIPVVAPEDGTVASINVAVGDAIESGAVLATLN